MSQNSEKLEIERAHFEIFRDRVSAFPKGEIFHEDKPDFRVVSDVSVVGIEHSAVFKLADQGSPPEQAVEAGHRAIVEHARWHAELQRMPGLHVDIDFDPYVSIPRLDRHEVGIEIARLCMQHIPDAYSTVELPDPSVGLFRLPSGVREIWMYRGGSNEKTHVWTSDRAGGLLGNSREILQAAIDQKAKLYSTYLKETTECWLLLVAIGISPSTFIEANEPTRAHHFTSPFARTFFLTFGPTDLVELRT